MNEHDGWSVADAGCGDLHESIVEVDIDVAKTGVGALIVWCRDARGDTVSSHSTSYHRDYVDTARTIILDTPARAPLRIELVRRSGRARFSLPTRLCLSRPPMLWTRSSRLLRRASFRVPTPSSDTTLRRR